MFSGKHERFSGKTIDFFGSVSNWTSKHLMRMPLTERFLYESTSKLLKIYYRLLLHGITQVPVFSLNFEDKRCDLMVCVFAKEFEHVVSVVGI